MAKFKVPAWLMPQSSAPDQKKLNRRSFSGFSQLRSKQDPLPAPKSVALDDAHLLPQSRIVHLARIIATETDQLHGYLRQKGLPEPSFAPDAADCLPRLPADMHRCRRDIIHATRELESLVRGPKEIVRWTVWNCLDTVSLQIINGYDIASLVPLDSPISLKDLAAKTSLDPTNLARALRHAMTNHIFYEPQPGLIAHTAASRELVQDAALQDWVGFNTEEVLPSAARALDSLRTYPEATSMTTTGFNFAFDTVNREPMFATLGKDAARARRMGRAMASLTDGEGYEVAHFTDNYDMSAIDQRAGTFVDIGGSHGYVCVDLARKWENMTFVVQDLSKTVSSAPKPICDDESVAARIQLQAHDFFEEQPVKGADVYFFRWIMHNYSTPYAVKLLKNLVPALKPGSRVVINDHCLRDPGSETPWDERLIRGMDLVMMALLNAQERHEHEFRALFRAADERFAFKGVTRTKGCRMSIVEAVWEPEEAEANGGPSEGARG